MKIAVLLILTALAQAGAQTTLKAVVEIGSKDEVKIGTLTVAETKLDFEGAELMFALPLEAIEDVQVAGFREKWLTVAVRANSEFARSYGFLLQLDRTGTKNAPGRIQFLLPPNADLKAAVAIARDFKARADVALADRQAVEQQAAQARIAEQAAAKTRAAEEAPQQRAVQQAASAPAPARAPQAQEKREEDPKVYMAVSAYYFTKKPGALMTSSGIPGELVLRSDGIGFAFHELNKLSADRQQATTDSRVFVPLDALQDGFLRDLRVLGGQSPTFFVVLVPRPDSELYKRLRPLLTDTGELLLHVRAGNRRGQINQYLAKFSGHQF